MSRMSRIVNYTCTLKNVWYRVFNEESYKSNRIKEIKVKLRETDTTVNHFRYNYDGSTTAYMTSTSGFTTIRNVKNLYCYVPDVDNATIEIEIVYF